MASCMSTHERRGLPWIVPGCPLHYSSEPQTWSVGNALQELGIVQEEYLRCVHQFWQEAAGNTTEINKCSQTDTSTRTLMMYNHCSKQPS